uniref:Uncharacterized protein n=1 Tax=Aegilops tauschii subsp. strangulata TaxID=200361 RepID=A0A453NVY0_AEGTS
MAAAIAESKTPGPRCSGGCRWRQTRHWSPWRLESACLFPHDFHMTSIISADGCSHLDEQGRPRSEAAEQGTLLSPKHSRRIAIDLCSRPSPATFCNNIIIWSSLTLYLHSLLCRNKE